MRRIVSFILSLEGVSMATLAAFFSSFRDRFAIRAGFFRQARKIWNCLALHWVVDDNKKTIRLTFAVPGLFTLCADTPALPWPKLMVLLAGGAGERAEYGLWHDYHETKLQWRKIVNLPKAGWERRWVHEHPTETVVKQETLLTGLTGDAGNAWAAEYGLKSWQLTLTTWHAEILRSFIPDLYDHYFVLQAVCADGKTREASLRAEISPRTTVADMFTALTQQIVLTKPAPAAKVDPEATGPEATA